MTTVPKTLASLRWIGVTVEDRAGTLMIGACGGKLAPSVVDWANANAVELRAVLWAERQGLDLDRLLAVRAMVRAGVIGDG